MARTVGLTFEGNGNAVAPEAGVKEAKRLTKAEVIEILTEKGIEFDKKAKLEDLMKLLDEEKDEEKE